jgi:hypothetical protein
MDRGEALLQITDKEWQRQLDADFVLIDEVIPIRSNRSARPVPRKSPLATHTLIIVDRHGEAQCWVIDVPEKAG